MSARILASLVAWPLTLIAGCGMSTEQATDRVFAAYAKEGAPGAVVYVLREGEPVMARTYGLASVEERRPVRPQTNFRLASLTKQFTAMSILMLVDRGELELDDTLGEIFADFPQYGESITLTHLLQHTSGIVDYEPFVPEDSPTQITDAEILELMKQQQATDFPPGTKYRYSNTGYALLAMVAERVSGMSFGDFLEQNIFDPLGMENTVAHRDGVTEVANRAYGYHVAEDGIVEFSDQSPWSAVLGDGGIYSSVIDLAKWDRALREGKLVSAALLEKAFTPNLENYGFGWRIDEYAGRTRIHHSGSTIGFRNFIQRFPDDGLTVIVLSNRRDPEVDPLAEQVADLFLD